MTDQLPKHRQQVGVAQAEAEGWELCPGFPPGGHRPRCLMLPAVYQGVYEKEAGGESRAGPWTQTLSCEKLYPKQCHPLLCQTPALKNCILAADSRCEGQM